MVNKEIYASVEIADHEVRLVVGEFYDSRFNVLQIERTPINGIRNKKIVDEQDVVNGIIKVAKKAEQSLGFHIERVLLALPSVDVKRCNQRVHVIPETTSKRIRLNDIQRGLKDAISYKPDENLELVNVGCIKYITNGITSRKMPIDEISEILVMNVDLLFANKEIVYSYARCIEKAGLEILDICLDSFAIAQEAAIFEQTVDKYVILVDLSRQSTTLTLFTHGKMVSCEVLHEGYGDWFKDLCENYHVSEEVAYRLVQNTCCMIEDEAKDNVIYVWSENGEQKQLTEKNVCDCVAKYMRKWVSHINESCMPIVKSGDVSYLVTGEGCQIQSIDQVLSDLNASWQIYVPQTIGARDASLASCLGLFYSWKEQSGIRNDKRTSCSDAEVQRAMDSAVTQNSSSNEEGGFTKKLKKILLNDR